MMLERVATPKRTTLSAWSEGLAAAGSDEGTAARYTYSLPPTWGIPGRRTSSPQESSGFRRLLCARRRLTPLLP